MLIQERAVKKTKKMTRRQHKLVQAFCKRVPDILAFLTEIHKKYKPLLRIYSDSVDILESAAYRGLCDATFGFKEGMGADFQTYAVQSIRNRFLNEVAKLQTIERHKQWDRERSHAIPTSIRDRKDVEDRDFAEFAISQLDGENREIIMRYFGIGRCPENFRDMARGTEHTDEYFRKRYHKAMRAIREGVFRQHA